MHRPSEPPPRWLLAARHVLLGSRKGSWHACIQAGICQAINTQGRHAQALVCHHRPNWSVKGTPTTARTSATHSGRPLLLALGCQPHRIPAAINQMIRTALRICLAVALVACAALSTPSMLQDMQDTRRLIEAGRETVGIVTQHQTGSRSSWCQYSATVQYTVMQKAFQAKLCGDDTQPKSAPLGTNVKVVYLPDQPHVSAAKYLDATTKRSHWGTLIGIWSVSAGMLAAAIWRA